MHVSIKEVNLLTECSRYAEELFNLKSPFIFGLVCLGLAGRKPIILVGVSPMCFSR